MYSNTESLVRLRTAMREVFGFAVVVCSSVPCLKKSVKLFSTDPASRIPRPEHFKNLDYNEVIGNARNFKAELSKVILLSSFSYFEAYVADCCKELLEFQRARLKPHFERDVIQKLVVDPKFRPSKRKLQDNYTPKKWQSYKKHTAILREAGYPFPKDILASYAIRKLLVATSEGNIKANDIPDFLKNVLLLNLGATTEKYFHNYRDLRNRIAHGKPVKLHLKQVITINRFFRDLAIKIDQHIVESFFVIEE